VNPVNNLRNRRARKIWPSKRVTVAGVLAAVFVLFAAPAAARPIDVSWRFREGETFYIVEKVTTDTTVTIDKEPIETSTTQRTVTRVKTLSTTDDGGAELELRFEKVEWTGGGDKSLARRMEGATLRLTLDANHRVTKLSGYSAFVRKIAGDNAGLAAVFRAMFPEETFRDLLGQIFALTSTKKVTAGEKWQRDSQLSLGPLGSLAIKKTISLAPGPATPAPSQVELTFTGEATYAPPKKRGGPLAFQVTAGELKINDYQGTAIHDAKPGRLVTVDSSLSLAGALTIKLGARESKMQIEQKQRAEIRVVDEAPK